MWILLLLTNFVYAQDENIESIRKLEEQLPVVTDYKEFEGDVEFSREAKGFRSPIRPIAFEKIIKSPTEKGSISAGVPIRNLENNLSYTMSRHVYVNYFVVEDELGFKYIKNKDGTVTWRILSRYVEPIKQELAMYEPPLKYTPAPENILRKEYDSKLVVPPEVSFYMGRARGQYMADLFNDNRANSGYTNQYGLHFLTEWDYPVKVGAVVNYETASYDLTGGGQVLYSAFSFGPQLKTRDFEFMNNPFRFQTQIRISPFARADGETVNGNVTFKFNSTDLLSSIERPFKNSWGNFVLGFFYQAQWLNIKDAPEIVSVEASNRINSSFGLSLSQVFQ